MQESEEQIKSEQDRQLEEIKQLKKDYLTTFNSDSGKKVLKHLEQTCFANKTTFSSLEGKTFLNEGMRYVIVHIKNMMNMDIKQLHKLVKGE